LHRKCVYFAILEKIYEKDERMNYRIKDPATLNKLLWLDFLLGSSTALTGLVFVSSVTHLFGLTTNLVVIISGITLVYAIVAFSLARQRVPSISVLRVLIYANWFWAGISCVILAWHIERATAFGQAFLVLQVLVVGGLAYLEGKQVVRN
jgi:hypothetical protein